MDNSSGRELTIGNAPLRPSFSSRRSSDQRTSPASCERRTAPQRRSLRRQGRTLAMNPHLLPRRTFEAGS
nr:hypothetical protein Iba_chr13fCG6100 [Ipomoea batatas]